VSPIAALERVMHLLDRSHEGGFRAKAFQGALMTAREVGEEELRRRSATKTLTELPGIGSSSAKVIEEALAGTTPAYLAKLEKETVVEVSAEAQVYLDALKGDCHLHSRWSDGGATIEAMAATAIDIGHEYMVLTDHSPRLTIAHGLNRDRLLHQLEVIAGLNQELAPFRILTGMEVDILEDGSLDLDEDLIAGLDVVVASVHSKLRSDRDAMTERMVRAVASPHVDILGHCTGRLIGKRPPSQFDPDYVFAACAQFHTAVEINSRVERLDPPPELLAVAIDHGCWFSIDSDAHATGQLEWQPHGCEKAAESGVPLEQIINTRSADDLLEWTGVGAA
jgi:putative hydrolase